MKSVCRSIPARATSQALIEFALVVPLFLLLLFALIDFGRLQFSYVSLTNAAREMARVAAIPGNSNGAVVDAFNNYADLILSPPVSTGPAAGRDFVTITVTDHTCLTTPATCATTDPPSTFACPLPLVYATCSTSAFPSGMPARTGLSGGAVDVVATNHYMFNPLFQNRLTGMIDASFMQQWATLSTTARTYIE